MAERPERQKPQPQTSPSAVPSEHDELFRLVEDRVRHALVASLLEDALTRAVGPGKAGPVIRELNAKASAWIEGVRDRCRSIAVKAGALSPDSYAEILFARATFGDLPGQSSQSKPGPRRRRPELSPREALKRYLEIYHALWGGDDIERLAKEWASQLSPAEIVALRGRPKPWVAARLAGAPFKVSADEMLKKVLPLARAQRLEQARIAANRHGKILSRDKYDEDSVANANGVWVQRRGQWFFLKWRQTSSGGFDVGEPVHVKGPWVDPRK